MDVNHFMNLMNEANNVNSMEKHCNSYGSSSDNIFLLGENGLSMTVLDDRDVVSALHSVESNDFNRGQESESNIEVKTEVNYNSTEAVNAGQEITRQNLERMVTRLDSIESMVNAIRREVCDLRSLIHGICNKVGLNICTSIGTFSQCHSTLEVERLAENLKEDSFYESMVRTCTEMIESGKDKFEMTQKILSFLIRKDVMGRINMSGRNQKLKFPPIITSVVHSALTSKGDIEFQDVEKLISRVLHNCIANLKRNQKLSYHLPNSSTSKSGQNRQKLSNKSRIKNDSMNQSDITDKNNDNSILNNQPFSSATSTTITNTSNSSISTTKSSHNNNNNSNDIIMTTAPSIPMDTTPPSTQQQQPSNHPQHHHQQHPQQISSILTSQHHHPHHTMMTSPVAALSHHHLATSLHNPTIAVSHPTQLTLACTNPNASSLVQNLVNGAAAAAAASSINHS